MAVPLFDLAAVERKGEQLRCPQCGRWVKLLLHLADRRAVCEKCAR